MPKAMNADRSKVYSLVLGAVVLRLREQRGWTQSHLAERVGTSTAGISRIERGTALPNALVFQGIAEAFGTDVGSLSDLVDRGMVQTRKAVSATTSAKKGQPWWAAGVAVAGLVGLAGLVAFSVAALLAPGGEPKSRGRK